LVNTTLIRRQNALALFQAYAEQALAAGTPPKGLEQAFAATLEVSPSMWSQIKSSRPIGDKLARQIEQHHGKPAGWLDQAREDAAPTPAEKAVMALALAAWRATHSAGRKALRAHLEALARPGPTAGQAPTTRQTTSPTSSATSRPPPGASTTPTGRP